MRTPQGELRPARAGPDDQSARPRSPAEVDPAAAEEFIELFHAENPRAGPAGPRIAAVGREIDLSGTYRHTPEEL